MTNSREDSVVGIAYAASTSCEEDESATKLQVAPADCRDPVICVRCTCRHAAFVICITLFVYRHCRRKLPCTAADKQLADSGDEQALGGCFDFERSRGGGRGVSLWPVTRHIIWFGSCMVAQSLGRSPTTNQPSQCTLQTPGTQSDQQ